jgi:hypothetical protein
MPDSQPTASSSIEIAASPESVYALITDAEPGTRFAFDVSHTGVPLSRWQYGIVGSGSGCTVTESTWDRRPGRYKAPAGPVTGVLNRAGANSDHIQATLSRLKARAETAAS